ncbi:hypothetical protein ACFW1F_32000 [Streptomyces bungoensis]
MIADAVAIDDFYHLALVTFQQQRLSAGLSSSLRSESGGDVRDK